MDQANTQADTLDLHSQTNRAAIERALPEYVSTRRWFGGKARKIGSVRVADSLATDQGPAHRAHVAIIEVVFDDGDSQRYVLPIKLDILTDEETLTLSGRGEIARWTVHHRGRTQTVAASDATFDNDFASGLLEAVINGSSWSGDPGDIVASHTAQLASLVPGGADLSPSVMGAEQSNTSILYGESLILKLFRRLEEGTSPELEIGQALQSTNFAWTPALGGAIEYAQPGREPLTLAVLQGYVPNRGDAWGYTIESLEGYYERALSGTPDTPLPDAVSTDPLELAAHEVPDAFTTVAGGYPESAASLGRTTAQMHLALARAGSGPAFAPEPLDLEHREQMYAAMRLRMDHALGLLENNLSGLQPEAAGDASAVLSSRGDFEHRFAPLLGDDTGGLLIRVHGDYHLGQVLYTGSDFFVIDFEGEPARSLAERRRKQSPLKDVAGMLRSFHYAAYAGLFNYGRKHRLDITGQAGMEHAAGDWYRWTAADFLREYLGTVAGSGLLPERHDGLRVLLSAYLLEKAFYELVYELNNRPTWAAIPIKGIAALLA